MVMAQVPNIAQVGQGSQQNPQDVFEEIVLHNNNALHYVGSRTDPSPTDSSISDVFKLQTIQHYTFQNGNMMLVMEKNQTMPNQLQFFDVTEEACALDMKEALCMAQQVSWLFLWVDCGYRSSIV